MGKSELRTKSTVMVGFLVLALLLVSGCGASQNSSAPATGAGNESAAATQESTQEAANTTAEGASDTQEEYVRALSAQGLVNGFIGEEFYDQAVEDEEGATAAVQSVLERLGGDETTKLQLLEIRPTETGTTYYTFRQQAGDVVVHGASVKLVVNKDHKAVGVVSALLPNVKLEDLDSWEISAEQAEKVVADKCKADGNTSAVIVKDTTEQTLIALDESNEEKRRYAWVVYTNNYLEDVHAAFLAHYVSADGEYLYAIPVSEPSNAESLEGDKANFDFDKMEQATWSGTVTKYDGTTMDIEVPVLKNPDNGDVILGDGKRKILCADFADFTFNKKLSPRIEGEKGFANNELIIYNTFIKVWDFYESIGWKGPDGEGTPTLLKMDMVDQNGDPVHNAYYENRAYGFQCFSFNRDEPDGECVDIIAHEFTHCVTVTTMTANLYLNDTGSINEGMSDVLGNLVEMMTAYTEDGAWVIGENGIKPIRSMKDPHAFQQPAFTWDTYYSPAVAVGTLANDRGGVHINSSLLNSVSYKLGQAGVPNEDQFYFWMNVALAMTPSTDYPQMAVLLPWCMEQAGFPQHVDAVKKAVEETRLTLTKAPDTPPEGSGFITMKVPKNPIVDVNEMRFLIAEPKAGEETRPILAWIGANADTLTATVPEGDYKVVLNCFDGEETTAILALTDDGWTKLSGDEQVNGKSVSVAAGKTVEIPSTGLEAK